MALASHLKRDKKERQGIYFELICGIISSILALIGIIFVTVESGIVRSAFFLLDLLFGVFIYAFRSL